jgi:hypothetical protein
MDQKQYRITLIGRSPLLMHRDNVCFGEKLKIWRDAPENKAISVNGDDRSPAWTWIGSLYEDSRVVGIDADNVMTMLREGGAKVKTGNRQETFKKQTQSGICLDQPLWPVTIDGASIPFKPITGLIGNNDFAAHMELAESLHFELFVKRARIGQSKHVRVRPLFRRWVAQGSLTVLDEEISRLGQKQLELILNQAGALCGIGDWRPSSGSSGTYGTFSAQVEAM